MKDRPRKRRREASIDDLGLRRILDAMSEPIFVVDDSGHVVLTNQTLDDLLGRDALGARPSKVVRSQSLRRAVRDARKNEVATEVEIEQGAIGDSTVTFHAQVSPLPKPGGVVVVFHDVSSLKAADRVRRDFVANAAHELRTPLTAIRAYAETLIDGALDDRTVAEPFLEGILRQTLRLQQLAEDLSLLSRAESAEPHYTPSPVDVFEVCRECCHVLEAAAADKGVALEQSLPKGALVLSLSRRALEEVVINLLENAIKHSPSGAAVRLAARVRDQTMTIDVRDEGDGIAREYHARIFERFFRVDHGRARSDGGSGLGLSIARHLVHRLGGSIAVRSAPGRGARFRITLPLEDASPADEPNDG